MTLTTLSTIAPTHRIRTIVICIQTSLSDKAGWTQLAAKLASLPMPKPPRVELEMDFDFHAEAMRIFAGLNSGDGGPFVSALDDTW